MRSPLFFMTSDLLPSASPSGGAEGSKSLVMKNSGLLIAAVVLAALTGALYWSNHHPPSENTAKASLDTPPKILALKQEDISKIAIKKKGGEELDLAKGDARKWQMTAPQPHRAGHQTLSGLPSHAYSLQSTPPS